MKHVVFLFFFSVIFLAGCASDSPLMNHPLYYDRGVYPLPVYRTFNSRAIDRSAGLTELRYGQNPSENPMQSVAAGLLSSGLSVAQNPDYFETNFVSGRCLCRRSAKDSLELPCSNVAVILADRDGKELSHVEAADGEFVFPAEKETQYRLRIASRRYSLYSEPSRFVQRGDDVVLHLVQRHASRATD